VPPIRGEVCPQAAFEVMGVRSGPGQMERISHDVGT
jgi:hypothetical protein